MHIHDDRKRIYISRYFKNNTLIVEANIRSQKKYLVIVKSNQNILSAVRYYLEDETNYHNTITYFTLAGKKKIIKWRKYQGVRLATMTDFVLVKGSSSGKFRIFACFEDLLF
jgi:hypothetical protein